MANYKHLIPFLYRWEGSWANDPADMGGATMRGITLSAYSAYCSRRGKPKPTATDLRNITDAEWSAVFKSMFWDRLMADFIHSQSVANAFVDYYWHSGVHAIKDVQSIIGVGVDGIVGTVTLNVINSRDPKELFQAVQKSRISFLERIVKNNPSQAKFLRGWLNRVNDMKYED